MLWFIMLVIVSTYPFIRMLQSFSKEAISHENSKPSVFVKTNDAIASMVLYCFLALGLYLNGIGVKGGEPLIIYELTDAYGNGYASLAHDHITSVLVLITLGMLSFLVVTLFEKFLSPLLYVVTTTTMIGNILFAVLYLIHTGFAHDGEKLSVWPLQISFIAISFLYIARSKISLIHFLAREKEGEHHRNKRLQYLFTFSHHYTKMHKLWAVFLFPIMVIIQLILVLFGQRPDSFIRVFLETSSFNYSTIPAPEPKVVLGDGHYLCTVTAKGHKKLVKPIRAGIRGGLRIPVNRQLLIANAFENILEQYTPRAHKVIRNAYDKYGYPISRHIRSKWSADIVYILMKPAEWIFLAVLYTVDKNPENRINIQYSELRK